MLSTRAARLIAGVWVAVVVLAVLAFDPFSFGSWALGAAVAFVPAFVLVRLGSSRPSPTAAELLHTTEIGR